MNRFPNTDWSLIDLASEDSLSGSLESISRLIETYRQPMYAHLRTRGLKHEQSEDLLQEFFMEFLNRKLLTAADRSKGRFRTLLLTALNRFSVGKQRYETAAKRSPGNIASLDASEAIQATAEPPSPSMVFERAWALDVIAQSLSLMQEECESEGQAERWSVFECRVIAPLLENANRPEYKDLAARYGLNNEKAAMNLLVTAKRQFDRILRNVVRDYVTRGTDIDQLKNDVARKLLKNETDEQTVMRVAEQVVEQNIHRMVQEEIDQLVEILGSSRAIADQIRLSDSSPNVSERKNLFWQRLASMPPESTIDDLYKRESDGTEKANALLTAILESALETRVGDITELQLPTDPTLRECLFAKSPDLKVLSAVKDWANSLRTNRNDSIPADVASGIYFLTIAIALVHCNEQITALNPTALRTGLIWMGGQAWVPERFEPLLAQALIKLD